MRDETLCSGKFFAGDGVHLTMQGYTHVWEKARRAAGLGSAKERTANASKPDEHPADTAPAGADQPSTAAQPPATTPPAPQPAAAPPPAATPPAASASAPQPPAASTPAPPAEAATSPRPAVVTTTREPDKRKTEVPQRKRPVHRETSPRRPAAAPTVAATIRDERFYPTRY
jgi:hypothetical protein